MWAFWWSPGSEAGLVTWSVAGGERWEGDIPQQKVRFETGELLYLQMIHTHR
jgi:hypothetical protein